MNGWDWLQCALQFFTAHVPLCARHDTFAYCTSHVACGHNPKAVYTQSGAPWIELEDIKYDESEVEEYQEDDEDEEEISMEDETSEEEYIDEADELSEEEHGLYAEEEDKIGLGQVEKDNMGDGDIDENKSGVEEEYNLDKKEESASGHSINDGTLVNRFMLHTQTPQRNQIPPRSFATSQANDADGSSLMSISALFGVDWRVRSASLDNVEDGHSNVFTSNSLEQDYSTNVWVHDNTLAPLRVSGKERQFHHTGHWPINFADESEVWKDTMDCEEDNCN